MPQTARPAAPGDNPDADEARAAYRAPARAAAEAELGGNEVRAQATQDLRATQRLTHAHAPPQLDATVKVCRACQNGAQRLYHIGRLGRVAVEAASGASTARALHSRQSLALRRAAPRASHHTRRSA